MEPLLLLLPCDDDAVDECLTTFHIFMSHLCIPLKTRSDDSDLIRTLKHLRC